MAASKFSWLEDLTLVKLHRLATSIGAPCSGTKSVRIAGLRRAIDSAAAFQTGVKSPARNLSLLSIDMGIRNLAFAHVTATVEKQRCGNAGYLRYGQPTLHAWRRVAVSQPEVKEASSASLGNHDSNQTTTAHTAVAESFEPIDYAKHAYRLIRGLLDKYEPHHILIERQRFRSGGQAAVQEWTIRVGVFEGMLYSVLQTLKEECKILVEVEPMPPPRVNRYWLEAHQGGNGENRSEKLTGRDVKRAKIDLVGKMLDQSGESPSATGIAISQDLQPFVDDFVSVWKKEHRGKDKRAGPSKSIPKLDDLADSLLQGLAWVDWQNNGRRLEAMGRDAVDMTSGALLPV